MPAAAQFRKPEDAIKYRQSAMALQGDHVGQVFAMANGRVPFDAKVAAENIEIVAMLTRLRSSAFVEGTDKGNTKAKPEIWTREGQVRRRRSRKSQDDVAKLDAAAKTGNLDQIKAAVGAVGQSARPATTTSGRSERGARSGFVGEAEHDAARHRRLLLDLRDDHGADLGGVRHVRAAAGLQVDAVDRRARARGPARAAAARSCCAPAAGWRRVRPR